MQWIKRLVWPTAVFCLLIASICLVGSMIPDTVLLNLGARLRRASDVTPDRIARLRITAVWCAANLAVMGVALVWCRSRVVHGVGQIPGTLNALWRFVAELSLRERCAVAGLTLFAALLRLGHLDQPMAYDEAYSWLSYARMPLYLALGDYTSTNNHLLNTICMGIEGRVFGPREWALRLHVYLAGVLLVPTVYFWARRWRGELAAFVAAPLTAVCAALVSYSNDARGYMLVSLFAILYDATLGRLSDLQASACSEVAERSADPGTGTAFWSGVAWFALTAGLCSMPIMLYPAISSTLWFVMEIYRTTPRGALLKRLFPQGVVVWWAIFAASLLYAPAFILRNFAFLNDPVIRAGSNLEGVGSQLIVWWLAMEWWAPLRACAFGFAWLLAIGIITELALRRIDLRWWLPFLTVSIINTVRDVYPPPRVFLFLAPWTYLPIANIGLFTSRSPWIRRTNITVCLTVLALATCVIWIDPAASHPEDRRWYGSVPLVVDYVQRELEQNSPPPEGANLLLPLPCDVPGLFYVTREQVPVSVNAPYRERQRTWLLVRHDATVDSTLASPLLAPVTKGADSATWKEVFTAPYVTLYEAGEETRP